MNPFQNFDTKAYDGKEIFPGVWIMGEITWNNELQRWTALAQVGEQLAVVELRITTH